MIKKTKVFATILGLGLLENLLFAMFLGASFNKNLILSTLLFTVVLTLVLDKMSLLKEC